jgi:dolichol-phosphate mannosyltransferase
LASELRSGRTDKVVVVRPAPEVWIIVPTFNESANVPILVERLNHVLAGCGWEVVFVDDNSADGTAAVARAIGEADSRVRCIRRIGRRGFAGACLEGMLASQARYLAVMDADLQHDEALLTGMLYCGRSEPTLSSLAAISMAAPPRVCRSSARA